MTFSSPGLPVFLVASVFLSFLAFLLLLVLTWSRRRPGEEPRRHREFLDQTGQTGNDVPFRSIVTTEGGEGEEGRKEEERRGRKKKGRRKKLEAGVGDEQEREREMETVLAAVMVLGKKGEEDFTYPFSSSLSATQRRIKQQYDLLVESNAAKGLTANQVGQFANCLVEARNGLEHKSEIIKRKFTIAKALLFKADRSTFGRLSRQIGKLEMEQKRLEEDALVYNRLQEQLKLSPAFQTMLELSTSKEASLNPEETVEAVDSEFADISFEDFLAQEKKDSFWQKHGKMRS